MNYNRYYCPSCHSWSCGCSSSTPNFCNPTIDDCGCNPQVKGKCVKYRGSTITCLGITTGMDYDSITNILANAICEGIEPPSGLQEYVVEGTSNQITVNTSTVGTTTTYTIALDSTITNFISDTTSDIASLYTCCDASIKEITSSSLDVTDEGGGTWNIEVIPPSGEQKLDGIIHSDITPATLPNGSGGDQVIKTFNADYNDYSIADGDEIRINVSGKIKGGATFADSIKLELYDSNTSSVLGTITFTSFSNATDIISSYWIEASCICDVTNSAILLEGKMHRNMVTSGLESDMARGILMVDKYVTGVDFANLMIRVKQVNDSLYDYTDNNVRSLRVELRKYIG